MNNNLTLLPYYFYRGCSTGFSKRQRYKSTKKILKHLQDHPLLKVVKLQRLNE
jgi:hypothetical protein